MNIMDAVGWFTGGNLSRLAATALIAASAGGYATWKVEEWRWNANTLQAKVDASEAARQREKGLTIANQGVDNAHQIEKARLAAAARVSDGKLREFVAELNRPGIDTAPLGGADDPRDAIIDQCATALVRLDGEAKSLALTTTSLQRYAAKVCVSQ